MKAIVVNDNQHQLSLVEEVLRRAGFVVESYLAAGDALKRLFEEASTHEGEGVAVPDLIVTDLYMPQIDGWRFCRLLKSPTYAWLNQVPVIVMSATFSGDDPRQIAEGVGADAFVSCPFDALSFIELANALARGDHFVPKAKVLIVAPETDETASMAMAISHNGYDVTVEHLPEVSPKVLMSQDFSICILEMPDQNQASLALLDQLHGLRPNCVFLTIATNPNPHQAMVLMKHGSAAYLQRPFDHDYLIEVIFRACRERSLLNVEDLLDQRTIQLREEEARFRLIAENTSDGILVFAGAEHELEYVSPAYFHQLGYLESDFLDVSINGIYDRMHPEDRDEIFMRIEKAIDSKKAELKYVYRIRHKRGYFVWHEDYARFRYDSDGTYMKAYVVCRDITERKKAEDSLLESESRNKALLDALPDMMFLIGYDGTFWDYHAPAGATLIQDPAKFIGKPAKAVLPPEVAELTYAKIEEVIRTGHAQTYQYELDVDTTGTPKLYESRMVKCGSSSVLAIVRDISEIREAERERGRLQQELVQAQKMESVGRLAGGVAHDFNNMLLVILGQAEISLDDIDENDPLREAFTEIRNAAQRSASLTRQLLAFARKQTIQPQVLDLNETVEGMLKMLGRLIGEDIGLVWEPDPGIGKVKMDPSQIDQLLANLCVNARDAIEDVGKITIRTAPAVIDQHFVKDNPGAIPGEYVRLSVEDTGSGMDKAVQERLFEPFFTTKPMGEGTGLGLATVYGIIKQNDGYVSVTSELSVGTTFDLYLPLHVETDMTSDSQYGDSKLLGGSETILLVEDEVAILTMTTSMLKRLGYTVFTAQSPIKALEFFNQPDCPEIDLLLTDVVMPEINGKVLSEKILEISPGIKCLFMSGYTANVIVDQGVLDDGLNFIQKPFSVRDIAVKLRDVLDGARV